MAAYHRVHFAAQLPFSEGGARMNRCLLFVMKILLLTIAACGPAAAPMTPPPSPTPAPPVPAIQSFLPTDAAPPGAVVSLQGQHFGDEQGAVTFGGIPAPVVNWDNTSIDVLTLIHN